MDTLSRLMAKVKINETTQCWEWTGSVKPPPRLPYGEISISGKRQMIHRAMWIEKRGPIPQGMLVCHKCDNPRCINPDHLFLGSYKDNKHDCMAKGRHATGDRHPARTKRNEWLRNLRTKVWILNQEKADEIRRRYFAGEKRKDLAKEFGVSLGAVDHVIRRLTWSQV